MTNPTITINNPDSFRQSISELTELNTSLAGKLSAGGEAVIAAVTAAATASATDRVVYPAAGSTVAAAYAGTLTALKTAVTSINAQANEASNAVANQIRDLTSLVDGLTNIDDAGAAGVTAAG